MYLITLAKENIEIGTFKVHTIRKTLINTKVIKRNEFYFRYMAQRSAGLLKITVSFRSWSNLILFQISTLNLFFFFQNIIHMYTVLYSVG